MTTNILYIGRLFVDAHGTTIEYMSNGFAFRDTKVSVVTTDNSPSHIATRMANFISNNLLGANSATSSYLTDEQQRFLLKTSGVLANLDLKSLALDKEKVRQDLKGLSIEWSIVAFEEQFDLVLR